MPIELQALPVPTPDYIARELKPCYREWGIEIQVARVVGKAEMQQVGSDWASRLAYGRNPQALHIQAVVSKE